MRNLDTARDSWQELKRHSSLQELKEAVRLDGRTSIATEGCRSACWKAFLLFDTVDTSTWQRTLASARSAYNALRAHCLRHLENPDEIEAGYDPLGGGDADASSPWTQLQKDEELRAEILQDVTRCMPENLYFRQPDTQRILLDILFIFAKLNPDVSYRQGMHELLAPILWVVERDAIDVGQSSKAMGEDATIVSMFDAGYIEHDTFALFSQMMQSAKNFYEPSTTSGNENPIVARSRRILYDLLPKVDEELAKHLASIDIVPQVFLMRWVRLLFGREFAFDDMLTMWDVIFAEDSTLEVVNEICVAMLLCIRWQLIEADYNEALTLLLRYPTLENNVAAQSLVLDAVYLREHMDYSGGRYLVSKYTGRPISQTLRRPVTPPALQRKVTATSGAHAVRTSSPKVVEASQAQITGSARNLEKVLQSTAKEIYARGEKLGIGKAVRNAVGEVHKRAQEIRDAPTPSPPRVNPHQRSRSAMSSYALQERLKSTETRNKQLAKLLEGAVTDLWDCQKRLADLDESREPNANPSSSVEELGIAIAKVQFVQVYLDDSQLPLPDEGGLAGDGGPANRTGSEDVTDDPLNGGSSEIKIEKASSGSIGSLDRTQTPRLAAAPSGMEELADPSTFEDFIQSSSNADAQIPKVVVQDEAKKPGLDAQETAASRPRLDQSSYSWMLGEPADSSPGALGRNSSFASQGSGRSKGFLFGDESESLESSARKDDPFDISKLRHGKK